MDICHLVLNHRIHCKGAGSSNQLKRLTLAEILSTRIDYTYNRNAEEILVIAIYGILRYAHGDCQPEFIASLIHAIEELFLERACVPVPDLLRHVFWTIRSINPVKRPKLYKSFETDLLDSGVIGIAYAEEDEHFKPWYLFQDTTDQALGSLHCDCEHLSNRSSYT